jgi:hypothetical protein
MKMKDAMKIISHNREACGFCVSFQHIETFGYRGDYFPEVKDGEESIKDEGLAWQLAREFAKKAKNVCEIYVAYADDFKPVENYRELKLKPIVVIMKPE